ncbi:MAG: Fe-S protein assembly co-chaperone HscB [Candidatus Midichloriaceae bacterium]|jgi:curved DNA-binding protein CbpA|nr:Fe-S protein assembly co-chaperone HscB [Candidatus Midichloriaceae bacterium]
MVSGLLSRLFKKYFWLTKMEISEVTNYFELFGLPKQLDLDSLSLQKTYFLLQKSIHPDNFINKPEIEKSKATEKAAIINKAYKVLSNKFTRAEYLISLHTSLEVKLPDDFVEQTFTWHEKLLDGEDLSSTLITLKENLWTELGTHIKFCAWPLSTICLAKIRSIDRIINIPLVN